MDHEQRRLELHELLLTFVDNVYFQPPPNLGMQYPCIVYERDSSDVLFADNRPYRVIRRYQVTYIGEDPDSPTTGKLEELPMAKHDRFFTADNLNHDVFTIFF